MTDPADTLDSALREHYAAQSLDDAALVRLQRIARQPAVSTWRWRQFAAAAAVLFALSITWYGWQQNRAAHLSREFIVEAALQHNTPFVSDVEAENFQQVQDRMPRLDFKPIEPQRCKQDDYRVVGARYVTLAGRTVAQIRLAYVEGAPMSLYEMPADAFPHVRAGKAEINGTPVTVWQENGLLMALAGTPAE